MGSSVRITTPIPTLDEVAKRLKIGKARQRLLIEIVTSKDPSRFLVHRKADGRANGRASSRNSSAKPPIAPKTISGVAPRKSRRVAAS